MVCAKKVQKDFCFYFLPECTFQVLSQWLGIGHALFHGKGRLLLSSIFQSVKLKLVYIEHCVARLYLFRLIKHNCEGSFISHPFKIGLTQNKFKNGRFS